MAVRATVIALVMVAVCCAFAPSALAYAETSPTVMPAAPTYTNQIDPSNCTACHGTDVSSGATISVEATGVARQGPHGGFTTTSWACQDCHMIHDQPEVGFTLLPGATLTQTCELCHDGTGGQGVYGTIEARGLSVQAEHRTETSTVVPGGNESTGGTATASFTGQGGTLTCDDCHSPHGNGLVEPFSADRRRTTDDDAGFFSSELLRRRPTGATTETPVYGSDWCAGCHRGRVSVLHPIINHPVDSSATVGPGTFYYENVQVVDGVNSSQTVAGSLGHNNFGYVMPWPRTQGQGTHSPICQQCHEDGRSVGDYSSGRIAAEEVFRTDSTDGTSSADNPRFQTFPHESQVANFLIEADDDLCTNCHHPGQMP